MYDAAADDPRFQQGRDLSGQQLVRPGRQTVAMPGRSLDDIAALAQLTMCFQTAEQVIWSFSLMACPEE